MGIYDRDYYRDDASTSFWAQRSVTANLILINAAIWVAGWLSGEGAKINEYMRLDLDFFRHPWEIWRIVTYGFAHDQGIPGHPGSPMHLVGNMLLLYFTGREVENIYGRKEYLRLYLSLIILAGLSWLVIELVATRGQPVIVDSEGIRHVSGVVGASGAIAGIALIFVLHYPARTVYFWGVIPIPIWLIATIWLVEDMIGATQRHGYVANSAHLAGAAFGYLYYRTGWQLGNWIPKRIPKSLSAFRLSPKLKVHKPADDEEDSQQSVDDVLAKISREGEASLTPGERRILEEASRRYQRRRQ